MRPIPTLVDRFDHAVFNAVYNTCLEDQAADGKALPLQSDDSILVITSAGLFDRGRHRHVEQLCRE